MRNFEKHSNTTAVVEALNQIFDTQLSQLETDLTTINNQLLDLPQTSEILYNSGAFEFSEVFDREYFVDISKIVSNYQSLGSYEGIIAVIKGIFGSPTMVEFQNGGKTIYVSNYGRDLGFISTFDDSLVLQEDNISLMKYVNNRLQTTFNNTIKLIRYFFPVGIKYEIILENFND